MTRSAADPVREAIAVWRAGVDAVLPDRLVRQALWHDDRGLVVGAGGTARHLPLAEVDRIVVVGAGKAGAGMAAALEETLGDDVLARHKVEGIVCVPDDDVRPLSRIELVGTRSERANLPGEEGVAAARRVRALVESAGPFDLLLVLLSGGASALLPAPVEGVTLADKRAVTRALQDRGADIREVNAVRKHLSDLKGGGLVRRTRAGRVVSLVVSDVAGDPLDVIASGPTAADPTTWADALAVLDRHGLRGDRCPASVRAVLEQGAAGLRPETLKDLPPTVTNVILGNNDTAVRAARRAAEVHGFDARASSEPVCGDTNDVAHLVASFVVNAPREAAAAGRPICLLFGGETTVDLGPSPGLGGRNMELVLQVLERVGAERMRGVVVLSGGTDGEDGPTDAAGAWADERVAREAASLGLAPRSFIERHDAYRFFERAGGLLRTGRTGTNVMDLRVVIVAPPPAA